MTPDELRSLADEATPGHPWKPALKPIEPAITKEQLDVLLRLEFVDVDKRLITLAPDLARLCAELGEALEALTFNQPTTKSEWESARAALAKLSELKS